MTAVGKAVFNQLLQPDFIPALNVTVEEIDQMISLLTDVLQLVK